MGMIARVRRLAPQTWRSARRRILAGIPTRLPTRLIVAGLVSLMLAAGTVVFTATRALEVATDQRALQVIESNMKVAWHELHQRGTDARMVDSLLLLGDTILNGDTVLADDLADMLGGGAAIFMGDTSVSASLRRADGTRATDLTLPAPVRDAVLRDGKSYRGRQTLLGKPFYVAYDPIVGVDGQTLGALFVGHPQSEFIDPLRRTTDTIMLVSGLLLLVVGGGFVFVGRRLAHQIASREDSLRDAHHRLDQALNNMANGLLVWSAQGTVALVNRRYCEVFGMVPDAVHPGMTLSDFVELQHQCGGFGEMTMPAALAKVTEDVARREQASFELRLRSGRVVAVLHGPAADGGAIATFEDVTERYLAERQMAFMARHDALTKLPNRTLFQERMDEALSLGDGVAVLCLDLDRFKEVNDTLGHPAGDVLLQTVSERLLGCVRRTDTVARLGGDEFAIIQPGYTDAAEIARTAARIIEQLSLPYDLNGEVASIGVSVGIGVAQRTGQDAESLLRQADLALYRAKTDGRATFRIFEPGMDAELAARRAMEAELQRAIAQEEFSVRYQPQISLRDGRVTGFEALLRWHHPTRGLIEPAEFIPVAESTGLIVPLGAWVLRRACADAATWPDHLTVAVNLSPAQFKNSNLLRKIRGTLAASGLPPHRLGLEITESALLMNTQATMSVLSGLIELGVHIALDDFGVGYSSLSFVRRFPVNKIKIDRSFTEGLGTAREADAIVRSVISLARELGVETLAEGVTTKAQLEWLRAEGCDQAQGFLISVAQPADAVDAMLAVPPLPSFFSRPIQLVR